jgi:hypothetical protein
MRRKVRNNIFSIVNEQYPDLHWRERFKIAHQLSKFGTINVTSGGYTNQYKGHMV